MLKIAIALGIFVFFAACGSAQDGIRLPQSFVDVSYPGISGRTIEVASDGDFQAALDQAAPGDEIVLQAGSPYVGNFRLPKKSGDNWIVIRTSNMNGISKEGQRVNPEEHSASMPKIISPNTMPAVSTESGAHHYRLVGIEITTQHSNTEFTHTNVVALHAPDNQDLMEKVPHHIIFDRAYIHGTPTGNVRRGVAINGAHMAVINSYLSDFHEIGADTQAIAGWIGPGPFRISNNYLEAAGENIMFGGGDPKIQDLVPSDIEITGNHFFKPLSWKEGDASYAGIHWTVKNLFELKNARRVFVDSNLFENNWADAQIGTAILLKSANQDGECEWCVTEHVTFSNNVVKNSGHGLTINAAEGNPLPKKVNSITIKNVLFDNVKGRLFQIFDGVDNVRIEHVTGLSDYSILMPWETDIPNQNFVFVNNIVKRGQYGIAGGGEGKNVLDRKFSPYTYNNNLLIVDDYSGIDQLNSIYPEGTSFAQLEDVGFADLENGNYELLPSSPFKNAASDGTGLGADMESLNRVIDAATGKSAIIQSNDIGAFASETNPISGASEDDSDDDDKEDEAEDEGDFSTNEFVNSNTEEFNQDSIETKVSSANADNGNKGSEAGKNPLPAAKLQVSSAEAASENSKYLQLAMMFLGALNLFIYGTLAGIGLTAR